MTENKDDKNHNQNIGNENNSGAEKPFDANGALQYFWARENHADVHDTLESHLHNPKNDVRTLYGRISDLKDIRKDARHMGRMVSEMDDVAHGEFTPLLKKGGRAFHKLGNEIDDRLQALQGHNRELACDRDENEHEK